MVGLPSGTVTFLFTDIEGSTSRWEHQPEAMRDALARHDALVRAAIEENDGFVVKTMGDAFHAVFVRAPDAVAAALDAQRRLQAETWGEVGPIRVRMAVHTGAAEERDGDYYGPPLNRAARLMSAGHGGQVLLSRSSYELVRDTPPDGATFVDLGEHRLKDLIHPERVFQVTGPDLPSAFPPLMSLDTGRNSLPIQPTPLIGREDDVRSVLGLLRSEDARLVTLIGPGGTGKTRLGLQVAAELIDQFSDGVVFVGLAPIRDPDLVAPTIGQALGIHDLGKRPILESLTAHLRERRLLLLLDNFEQILPAASVVAELLATCPGLSVLVTSRSPLHLRGEHEVPVFPLALPPLGVHIRANAVAMAPSVALFVQRATDVRPDFALTDEIATPVAEICRRLDGLPLALELAAARIKLLSPAAMLARLERRLPLLIGGARDLPERQRTLRDAINWSYDLLDEAEQRLFRRLSVFVGGSTLEAIEAVCDPDHALSMDVLDGVASLVDKSLVRQIDGPDHESRFTMLETVREFAAERLAASGEHDAVRRWHAEYYLAFVEVARPRLRGPEARAWLDRLEADHDNLRAAMDWGEASSDLADGATSGIEVATRIAKACAWFWMIRGHLLRGYERVDRLIASAPGGSPAHARALLVASGLASFTGNIAESLRLGEEGLTEWRALGDRSHVALALARVGDAHGRLGRFDLGCSLLAESEALSGDSRHHADLEYPIAYMLARSAIAAGDFELATKHYETSLELGHADRDTHTILGASLSLGLLAQRQGDVEKARALHTAALRLADQLGDHACRMHTLAGLAFVASGTGDFMRAVRLLAVVGRLRKLTGMVVIAYSSSGTYDQSVAAVRRQLGEDALAVAWAAGEAMSLEEAVAYALEDGR